MITIAGTVREILGKPIFFLTTEAIHPVQNAPIKAAAPIGIWARSTSSNRNVLVNIPMRAAVNAIFLGLLNIRENP